jgi:hypothetical protein
MEHPKKAAILAAAIDQSSRPIRVIGLAQPCPVSPPAEMVLLSLEEWTTFAALRWFFTSSGVIDDAIDDRLQDGLLWDAEDDFGNHYDGADFGGGGGNANHWVKTSWFAPAIPQNATRLTLRVLAPVGYNKLEVELNIKARS